MSAGRSARPVLSVLRDIETEIALLADGIEDKNADGPTLDEMPAIAAWASVEYMIRRLAMESMDRILDWRYGSADQTPTDEVAEIELRRRWTAAAIEGTKRCPPGENAPQGIYLGSLCGQCIADYVVQYVVAGNRSDERKARKLVRELISRLYDASNPGDRISEWRLRKRKIDGKGTPR